MQSGCRNALYAAGATATVALCFIAALEVSIAAIPPADGIGPAAVDRSNKSDRLPALRMHPAAPLESLSEPKLPEGCVSATAWRKTTIYANEIAGRCVV